MTLYRCWSLRAYRRLLTLYPEDLRRDFGPEMLEAFDNDLLFERSAYGLSGAVRIWRIALWEMIRIVIPAWLQIPAVAVPLLSCVAVVVSQSPLLIVAMRQASQAGLSPQTALFQAILAIAIDAAVAALTSFVAVRRWRRASLVSLGLGFSSCSKHAI